MKICTHTKLSSSMMKTSTRGRALYDSVLRDTAAQQVQEFIAATAALHGRPCATLIQQILNNRNIYVFSEFLDVPSIAQLREGEFSLTYNTLELFAYGTYREYAGDISSRWVLPAVDNHLDFD
jgi:hypothetical protein